MPTDIGIVLRAWYRFAASDWLKVRRSGYLAIELPDQSFMLDAFYDPGPLEDEEHPARVIFRGYLFDTPSSEILAGLRGELGHPDDFFKATKDGLGALPEAYGNYLKEAAARLSRLAMDAYDLLRWRHSTLDGPNNFTIDPGLLFWAVFPEGAGPTPVDSLDWRQVHSGMRLLGLPPGGYLDVRPQAAKCVVELLKHRTQAPLGHVLFREAWRIRDSNFRSSLVMAVAAAESGVKEFISSVAPDTSWLLENLSSPPLDRILRDYLPTLASKAAGFARVPSLSKSWQTTLQRAIAARNRIVHGRAVALDEIQLDATLSPVLEFLYFLDQHAGHSWATEPRGRTDDLD